VDAMLKQTAQADKHCHFVTVFSFKEGYVTVV